MTLFFVKKSHYHLFEVIMAKCVVNCSFLASLNHSIFMVSDNLFTKIINSDSILLQYYGELCLNPNKKSKNILNTKHFTLKKSSIRSIFGLFIRIIKKNIRIIKKDAL